MSVRRGSQAGNAEGEESPASRFVHNLFGVFGVLLAVVSAAFVAMAIVDLFTGGSPETGRGTLVGLAVLFGGGTVWGLKLAVDNFGWHLPHRLWPATRDRNQEVLAYAVAAGGRVTAVEVAGHCQLSIEQSEKILSGFAARGVAGMLMTEEGLLVYDFDVPSNQEKEEAREIG